MGAKPTHYLTAKRKDREGVTTRIGAGWTSDYGVTIRLDPCVVISWRDDVYLNLNPAKGYDEDPEYRGTSAGPDLDGAPHPADDEDVPFG